MTTNIKISQKQEIQRLKSVKFTDLHNSIKILIICGYSVILILSRTLHLRLKLKKIHNSSLPIQSNTKIFTRLCSKLDYSKIALKRTLKMLRSKNKGDAADI
jgi:hypothetical protein